MCPRVILPQDSDVRPLSRSDPADSLSYYARLLCAGARYGYILSLRAFPRQYFGACGQFLATRLDFATHYLSG